MLWRLLIVAGLLWLGWLICNAAERGRNGDTERKANR